MVVVSPQDLGLWDPFQNHLFMAEIHGGDPITTYPSPGMILQVPAKWIRLPPPVRKKNKKMGAKVKFVVGFESS